jgi:hypothetical protein
MTDESTNKHQNNADSADVKNLIELTTNEHESNNNNNNEENHLDQQIEQEENSADNLVIRDLLGSVKPESNKVKHMRLFVYRICLHSTCSVCLETER